MVTDTVTGKVRMDNIPLTVSMASAQINGNGSLSATLQLRKDIPVSLQYDMVNAVRPWKNILWVFQDDYPVWAGPITSWMPTTIQDAQLPLQAATMEQFFAYRQISSTLSYTATDVFSIFTALGKYAVGKTPNGNISGLTWPGNTSGTTDTISYDGTQYQMVSDAWSNLVSTYDMEYTISPSLTEAGNIQTQLKLGMPTLGRPYADTQLQFIYPSANVTDYQMQIQSNNPANLIVATGQTSAETPVTYASQLPHGEATAELVQGYPLLEGSVSIQTPVTSQAQVNTFADGYISGQALLQQYTPVIVLGPSGPQVKDIQLGDECVFIATSPLDPPDPNTGAPGLMVKCRVTGWTIYPPSPGQAEYSWINLAVVEELS